MAQPMEADALKIIKGLKLRNLERIEQNQHILPEFFFTAASSKRFLEAFIHMLQALINEKSNHHKIRQDRVKVFFSMPKIVFKFIALILEGIKCFIFNAPSGSSSFRKFFDIVEINGLPDTAF